MFFAVSMLILRYSKVNCWLKEKTLFPDYMLHKAISNVSLRFAGDFL